jgi:hypothetical protein
MPFPILAGSIRDPENQEDERKPIEDRLKNPLRVFRASVVHARRGFETRTAGGPWGLPAVRAPSGGKIAYRFVDFRDVRVVLAVRQVRAVRVVLRVV